MYDDDDSLSRTCPRKFLGRTEISRFSPFLSMSCPLASHESPATTYSSYLCIPELLALQSPKTDTPDELLFIITHQSHELWFKQIIQDLQECNRKIRCFASSSEQGSYEVCITMIDRCSKIFLVLRDSLQILQTMDPKEFQRFRPALGTSSGLQSDQWRSVEAELQILGRAPNLQRTLLTLETAVTAWRTAHEILAEKMIGIGIKGTGGTSGVDYLKSKAGSSIFSA